VLPVFFMGGLSGAFFRAAVRFPGDAVDAIAPRSHPRCVSSFSIGRASKPGIAACPLVEAQYGAALVRIIDAPRQPLRSPESSIAGLAVLFFGALPPFSNGLSHALVRRRVHPTTRLSDHAAPSRELRAIPGVVNFGAHIGRASVGTSRMASIYGELGQRK
jgi:hypothetical protein